MPRQLDRLALSLCKHKARLVVSPFGQKLRVLPEAKRGASVAIGRLSVKVGKVGKAQPHAAYIARQGQYASRLEKGEQLEHTAAGNMPAWAQHDPLTFWQAADTFERKNGSTYREYEIALPRELTPNQRRELVDDFVKQELGNKHAYQYAIHNPTAADGQEQPHCHLMFCERINDGIERDPDQYFKRYNSKHPERGGAEKANKSKDFATRQHELKQLRQRWEKTCNQHLERAGSAAYIDMRSYQERGLDRVPEPKQLPSQWRKPEQQAELIELRQTRQANDKAQAELKQAMPNLDAEIIDLEKREKQRERLKQARQRQKATADLTPENIEKTYQAVLAQVEEALSVERKQQKAAMEQADKQWSKHYKQRPQPPQGLFARFKQKAYERELNHWEKQEKALRSKRISTELAYKERGIERTPHYLAHQQFQAQYPKLAKERERLQQVEREKQEQKLKQEREQRQKERQLRRGRDLGR